MAKEIKNVKIPVYVRRSFDMLLDTNGYPHTEGNRQALYNETIKHMSSKSIKNINQLALDDRKFVDNEFSSASSKAFHYCEDNDLFRQFKEGEDDYLPGECYDIDFYKNINSKWQESRIKD